MPSLGEPTGGTRTPWSTRHPAHHQAPVEQFAHIGPTRAGAIDDLYTHGLQMANPREKTRRVHCRARPTPNSGRVGNEPVSKQCLRDRRTAQNSELHPLLSRLDLELGMGC